MARVTGATAAAARLRRIRGPEAKRLIGATLFSLAQDVQVEAQLSITKGAVSGKNHVPSTPGTAPNQDTGVLSNNIEAVQISEFRSEASSNAPYAAIHEFGGTINHPGGTPYFIDEKTKLAKFVSKSSPAAAGLPVTKPHVITMPERPYMRPAVALTKDERLNKLTALRKKLASL